MNKSDWSAIETLGNQELLGAHNYFSHDCGYEGLIESCGVTIHVQQDMGSYQGDSLAIVGEDGRIGWINWGWGSCSGCDALEACDSFDDLIALRESLYDSIRWFDSPAEMLAYWNGKDWATEWFSYEQDSEGFVDKGRAFLEGASL